MTLTSCSSSSTFAQHHLNMILQRILDWREMDLRWGWGNLNSGFVRNLGVCWISKSDPITLPETNTSPLKIGRAPKDTWSPPHVKLSRRTLAKISDDPWKNRMASESSHPKWNLLWKTVNIFTLSKKNTVLTLLNRKGQRAKSAIHPVVEVTHSLQGTIICMGRRGGMKSPKSPLKIPKITVPLWLVMKSSGITNHMQDLLPWGFSVC